ncbi:MAG: hypothetical protein RMM53_11940, partial [Bacteroidia bacterium]|nr:hypothetical protein [Bacteroidia bacterium]
DELAAVRRAESDYRDRAREDLARSETRLRQAEERCRMLELELERVRLELERAEKNNAALQKRLNVINFAPVTEDEERLRLKKKVRRLLKNIDECLRRLDE